VDLDNLDLGDLDTCWLVLRALWLDAFDNHFLVYICLFPLRTILLKHIPPTSSRPANKIAMSTSKRLRRERKFSPSRIFISSLLFLSLLPTATAYTTNRYIINNAGPLPRPARWGPPEKRDSVPLVISNQCDSTIWPGIGTQAGTGAGTGGFELASGSSMSLMVSTDWQGRVWGRTNCSFNAAGTGASNLNGNNGGGAACTTGDCGGVLSCVITVKFSSFP
jgi:hypothetical protein